MSDKPHPALLRAARATIDANTSGTIACMVDVDTGILDAELHYTELVEALQNLVKLVVEEHAQSKHSDDYYMAIHMVDEVLAKIDFQWYKDDKENPDE